MKNQKQNEKTARAYAVLAQLKTRYRVRICGDDRTAVVTSEYNMAGVREWLEKHTDIETLKTA